jgi:hypothetical protein
MREMNQDPVGAAVLGHAKEIGALQADMTAVKARLESIEDKLQQLVDAANMGKGMWWASVKVGGLILTVAGGLAWAWQHMPHPWRPSN